MDDPAMQALVCAEHGHVRLRRPLPAPAGQVWKALTTASQLEQWLGRLDGEAQVLQAAMRFDLWHDSGTSSQHQVTRWEPDHALGLTWVFPDEPPSAVVFTLRQHAADCTIEVEHSGLDEPVEYAAGWHRHLDFLAATVGGQDMSSVDFWTDHSARVDMYEARVTTCAADTRSDS